MRYLTNQAFQNLTSKVREIHNEHFVDFKHGNKYYVLMGE